MEWVPTLLLMIAIGGLIGYSTNKIAVKMLFRPHKKRRFLFFSIQGVLPKRKDAIAISVGETIENALLNSDDIFEALLSDNTKAKFKQMLEETLIDKIHRFIPSLFRTMIGDDLDKMIQGFIDREGDHLLEKVIDEIKTSAKDEFDIKAIVEKKILDLDFETFERMVKDLIKKELSHIERIGLLLGALIGTLQFLITLFI